VTNLCRLAACKKIPGLERAHFEFRRGTEQQASDYCKKDGDWISFGTCTKQPGERTDVAAFKGRLEAGASDLELMDYDFNAFSRFMKVTDRYRTFVPPKRTTNLEVYLLVGKPGTGKTKSVYDICPTVWAFPIGKDLWSDGYAGQPDVLLDDFSGQMRLVDTLRLLDRYPIQIPRKGGFNWWCPTRIFITTNNHPRTWYDWAKRPDQELALRRRMHYFLDFDNINDIGDNQVSPDLMEPQDYWPIESDLQREHQEKRAQWARPNTVERVPVDMTLQQQQLVAAAQKQYDNTVVIESEESSDTDPPEANPPEDMFQETPERVDMIADYVASMANMYSRGLGGEVLEDASDDIPPIGDPRYESESDDFCTLMDKALQKDWTDDVLDTLDEMPELSNPRPIGPIYPDRVKYTMLEAEEKMLNARREYVRNRTFQLQNKMELAIVDYNRAKEVFEVYHK